MATFANQASNLSTLGSALTSYSHILDVRDPPQGTTREEHLENAEKFILHQKERVDSVSEVLLAATGFILPESRQEKTATELAELCRLVQEATRQKLALLKTRLELAGGTIDWNEPLQTPTHASTQNDDTNDVIHWSAVGGPLECVIEGDVETEGATTPGSLLHPSPFASASKRRTSLTPTTPTLDNLSFTASTTSILERMNMSGPSSAKKWSARKSTRLSQASASSLSERQLNFDGFQDEDDMITLESQANTLANRSIATASPKEERSQFLARMESMLERVEESIVENRPTDETNGSWVSNTATIQRPSNSKFLDELVEQDEDTTEESNFDDDSTNVVATQVASVEETSKEPSKIMEMGHKPAPNEQSPDGQNIIQPVPVFHRPTHIVVDTGFPSPAHTNLTMDATMMNETMMSASAIGGDDDDNDSTVTPILDRYRLDPDDNSIGIKVVPNKRGEHAGNATIQTSFVEAIPEVATPGPDDFYTDGDGFRSPRGLPGSVSARKKQYRKTPFPKKKLHDSFQSLDTENGHPNVPTQQPSPRPASDSSLDLSFSVPPLRSRSYCPSTNAASTPNQNRAQSLPGSSSCFHPTKPRAVPSPRNVAKDMSDAQEQNRMEKITMAEYDQAPRVVKMQVTREEVNQSLDILEGFLRQATSTPVEFSEDIGLKLLAQRLGTDQKSKCVLMSLCHWRRLLMYRDTAQGVVFAVNEFEQ